MMKRSIRLYCEQTGNEEWGAVISKLIGNVGLVFTKRELSELQEEISKYRVGAPARVGAIAPKDVVVPAGSTGMDPSQTSFFQVISDVGSPLKCGLGFGNCNQDQSWDD